MGGKYLCKRAISANFEFFSTATGSSFCRPCWFIGYPPGKKSFLRQFKSCNIVVKECHHYTYYQCGVPKKGNIFSVIWTQYLGAHLYVHCCRCIGYLPVRKFLFIPVRKFLFSLFKRCNSVVKECHHYTYYQCGIPRNFNFFSVMWSYFLGAHLYFYFRRCIGYLPVNNFFFSQFKNCNSMVNECHQCVYYLGGRPKKGNFFSLFWTRYLGSRLNFYTARCIGYLPVNIFFSQTI